MIAGIAVASVAIGMGLHGGRAFAQKEEWIAVLDLPNHDEGPQVRGRFLETVALGYPDDRLRRPLSRGASARAQGKARGVEALHRFVDDVLASVQVHPRLASEVHAALDRGVTEHAVRPLVDGSAAVQVRVARSVLRRAAPSVKGSAVPW